MAIATNPPIKSFSSLVDGLLGGGIHPGEVIIHLCDLIF